MMLDVYAALKNRAASGQFALTEMTAKINTLWVDGTLTDAQREELLALAQSTYDPTYSPLSQVEQALKTRIIENEAALIELAALIAGGGA